MDETSKPGLNITGNVQATNSAIAGHDARVTHITNTTTTSAVAADADSINTALVELAARIRSHTGELADPEDLAAKIGRAHV